MLTRYLNLTSMENFPGVSEMSRSQSESESRKPSHDSIKACKCFLFSVETSFDIRCQLFRFALLIFLVISFSFVLYFSVTSQTRWFRFPGPSAVLRHSDGPCGSTGYLSGDGVEETNISHIEFGIAGSAETNISHIQFGIAGSVKTWKNRRCYSDLWWRPNVTRGYVWLDGKPDDAGPWPKTSMPYRVSEDCSRFKYSPSQSAVRIARIVSESFRVGLANVRWLVIGDDDTVFFTDNLVSVLAKYDHREMYYIGANSESIEQDVRHAYSMAFGGGGFAVSYGLAAKLATTLDGCLHRYYNFYGSDERIWACVSDLGVPLTTERGFHQVGLFVDPSVLLEHVARN